MSIKIYSGYRLDEGLDAFEFSKQVRDLFKPLLTKRYRRSVLNMVIKYYDSLTVADGKFSNDYRSAAKDQRPVEEIGLRDIVRTVEKTYNVKIDAVDANVDLPQVTVLYGKDPVTGRILCYFLGDNITEQKFSEMEGVNYYGYWDNTDQEEGVSDEDWDDRIKTWERTVDIDRGLGESMLSAQVFSQFDLYKSTSFASILESKDEKLFPTEDERLDVLVRTALLSHLNGVTPDNFMRSIRYALSDKEKRAEYEALFASQLEDLSMDSLREKYLAS